MTNSNISFDSLVSQLVTVFESADQLADYQNENVQQEIGSGWTGEIFSPISRPAYVQEFGADVVERAEKTARQQIEAEKAEFEKGDFFAASRAADELRDRGGLPGVGNYVWTLSDGCKCCDGVPGVFHDIVYYGKLERAELCKVLRVEQVDETFWSDRRAADALVLAVGADIFPGGGKTYQTPQGERFIINVCLCVSPSGKYCYIDSEGYNYARYILFGENYKTVFSAELAAEQAKKDAEDKAKAEKEAQEKAARKADYLARCAQWSGIMEPVAKYEAAEQAASWRTPEGKKAARKLQSVRRSNILRMFKKACPGVKVSIRKNDGWGKDWYLTYQDGPTLEELEKITDFPLFQDSRDVKDYYSDCWESERLEFTEFAAKYMGSWGGNGIQIYREMTEETKADIKAKVCEAVPGVADRSLTAGGYDVEPYAFTREELDALAEKFGLTLDQLCGNGKVGERVNWSGGAALWISSLVSSIFDASNYQAAVVEDKGSTTPSASDAEGGAAVGAGAPDGLQLEEILGGVAVVGDSRTTYRHRKEIKAKGCAWNREAKRWEATTGEAVAAVKAWFGVADVDEDQAQQVENVVEVAPEEVETVQTVAAAAAPAVKTESILHYSVPEKLEDFPIRKMSEFFEAHPDRRGCNLFGGFIRPTTKQSLEQRKFIMDFFGVDVCQIHQFGSILSDSAPYRDGSGWIGDFRVYGRFAEEFKKVSADFVVRDSFGDGSLPVLMISTEKQLFAFVRAVVKAGFNYVLIL